MFHHNESSCCIVLEVQPVHFKGRMERIADHMNSPAFAARDGTGLFGLAMELRPRCQAPTKAKGERLPK